MLDLLHNYNLMAIIHGITFFHNHLKQFCLSLNIPNDLYGMDKPVTGQDSTVQRSHLRCQALWEVQSSPCQLSQCILWGLLGRDKQRIYTTNLAKPFKSPHTHIKHIWIHMLYNACTCSDIDIWPTKKVIFTYGWW